MDAAKVLRSRRVFDGRVFSVRIDDVEYSDASTHRLDVVEHAASLGIIATPAADEIILVRQYRHPAGTCLWEIPAGNSQAGESLAAAAARELREETGYSAARLVSLGSVWTSPGFCSEVMHFFHADGLSAGKSSFDDDERIEQGRFHAKDAWRLVACGTADAKTLLALSWLASDRSKLPGFLGR